MHQFGLIGGKNPSLEYYKQCLLQEARSHSILPKDIQILEIHLPFDSINSLLPTQKEKVAKILLPDLKKMAEYPNSKFIVSNITLHESIDEINDSFYSKNQLIPLKSIMDKLLFPIGSNLMWIGSKYTNESPYFQKLLNRKNWNQIHPTQEILVQFDHLRRTIYEKGVPSNSNELWKELLFQNQSVDFFIIACTELAIASETWEYSSKRFNLSRFHCSQLFDPPAK